MQFILLSSLIAGHIVLAAFQTPESNSPLKFPFPLTTPPPPLEQNLPPTPFPPFPPYPPPIPEKLLTGPSDTRQYLIASPSYDAAFMIAGPTDDRQYTLNILSSPPPPTLTPTPTETPSQTGTASTPTPTPTPTATETPSQAGIAPTLTPTPIPISPEIPSQTNIPSRTPDSTKPFVSSVQFESGLGAIPPRQVTPSRDDSAACRSFWQLWPQGFNGSQTTHCYPLSAIGKLLVHLQDTPEPFPCTGALIGPRIVLTAAHCFTYIQEKWGKTFTYVEFTPGQFGDYKPFGSFSSGVVHTPEAKFNASQDYAVVEFTEDIGSLTGWLGIEYKECGSKAYDVTVAGYSEDKSKDKMWASECDNTIIDPCLYGDQSGTFEHMCDTNPGTSGAPLFENNIIVGIHQAGILSARVNVATFISRQLMDFISIHQN